MSKKIKVLFVCLGNICRSPTAEGIFRKLTRAAGLSNQFIIDSAGTDSWHTGDPPDPRMIVHAGERRIDLTPLRARQALPEDFQRFDIILAMDRDNLAALQSMQPTQSHAELSLIGDFVPPELGESSPDIPDPYYGGSAGFERVLDMLEAACEKLLEHFEEELRR